MEVTMSGRADSHYRVLANGKVKYITIEAGALDAASLDDMDLDFQNVLPPLPYHEDTWKQASITRNPSSGQLEAALSSADLPGVKTVWHLQMINHLDIERTGYLALLAQECKWKADSGPERMIAKMARFSWEGQHMEAETRMYQVLGGLGIAPKFLGHVHEEGRVIGFLWRKSPTDDTPSQRIWRSARRPCVAFMGWGLCTGIVTSTTSSYARMGKLSSLISTRPALAPTRL